MFSIKRFAAWFTIASLFVAYIFTPYLATRLLKKPKHKEEGKDA